jgi:hypothetical protein
VDISGTTHLSAEAPQAVEPYRVVAPLGTELEVEAEVRAAPGMTVQLALMSSDAQPATDAGAQTASSITVVVGPNGQAEKARLALPRCDAPGCEDYRVSFEMALLNGTAADVEWVARAKLEECSLNEPGPDDEYMEIRRE